MNNDLISRKALREDVKTMFCSGDIKSMMLQKIDNAPTVDTTEQEEFAYNEGYAHGLETQRPQGEWIPVSERLPENGRPVLIYAWNVHHVVARYDSFRTEGGYKKCWVTADAWNGNTEIKNEVIAWQPLPEL